MFKIAAISNSELADVAIRFEEDDMYTSKNEN